MAAKWFGPDARARTINGFVSSSHAIQSCWINRAAVNFICECFDQFEHAVIHGGQSCKFRNDADPVKASDCPVGFGVSLVVSAVASKIGIIGA
jgi:hypothetical protein